MNEPTNANARTIQPRMGISQQARHERQAAEKQQPEQGSIANGPGDQQGQMVSSEAMAAPRTQTDGAAGTIPLADAPADIREAIERNLAAGGAIATVDSASDARTVNNVMRHEYRVLSDLEKQRMKEIKDAGADLIAMFEDIGGKPAAPGEPPRMASRELSLAMTKVEEAVMWAVKHITA